MRRTGVRVSVNWNFIIHQIFPEFLQGISEFNGLPSSIVVSLLFSFWVFVGLSSIRSPWSIINLLDTCTGEMSLLFPSSLSRIWISLTVSEEDEDEEDDEEWLSCFKGVFEVNDDPEDELDKTWYHDRNEVFRIADYPNPFLNEMWYLTIDPFVGISVFIAKLSERQYCWCVFEDFHSQEYIQFFDIHNCLFMRLHFTIGGYDYRRTARFRQSIHFNITQVLFCWSYALTHRSPQQILVPQV